MRRSPDRYSRGPGARPCCPGTPAAACGRSVRDSTEGQATPAPCPARPGPSPADAPSDAPDAAKPSGGRQTGDTVRLVTVAANLPADRRCRAPLLATDGAQATSGTLIGTQGDLDCGLPKCAHACIQRIRGDVVSFAGRVLVDDRRVHAVVAHPRHKRKGGIPRGRPESRAGEFGGRRQPLPLAESSSTRQSGTKRQLNATTPMPASDRMRWRPAERSACTRPCQKLSVTMPLASWLGVLVVPRLPLGRGGTDRR